MDGDRRGPRALTGLLGELRQVFVELVTPEPDHPAEPLDPGRAGPVPATQPRRAHAAAPAEALPTRRRQAPGRRQWALLGGLAALPLVAVLGVVALLPRDPPAAVTATGSSRPATSGPTSAASRSARPPATGGPTATSTAALSSGQVAGADLDRLLDQAGVDVPEGSLGPAWTWKDADGRGLLLTTTSPDDESSPRAVTMRFVVVTDVERQPQVRVRERDSGPRCPQDQVMAATFTPGSITVTDTDGDGRAEVTVGWTHRCGSQTGTRVRMVTVTESGVFLMRASGVLGGPDGALIPTPDPPGARWPAGLLTSTARLFARIYR